MIAQPSAPMNRPRPQGPSRRDLTLAFAATWLLASAWGSVVQTQFNLAALTAFAVEVPLGLRLLTSLQDLVSFGGVYAGIVLASWLPAFAVAAWLARRWPGWRVALFAAAAGVGVIVAIRAVDAVAPMPVFIDATRSMAGLLTMALGSALAGALFARWSAPRQELGAGRPLEARS